MRKRILGGPGRARKKLVIKKNGGKVEPVGSAADKHLKDLKESYMKKNKKQVGGPVYNAKGVRIPGMQMGGSLYPRDRANIDKIQGIQPNPNYTPPPIDKRTLIEDTFGPNESYIRSDAENRATEELIKEKMNSPIPGSATELIDVTNEKGTFKQGVYNTPEERDLARDKKTAQTELKPTWKQKGGPVKKYKGSTKAYKEGGAVFNRQGIKVPGMKKGR